MPADGRRFALYAFLVVAVLGVLLSTLWVTFWAGLTLDQAGPGPVMVRQMALSTGIGCGLLVAATFAFHVLHVDRWLVVVVAIPAALLAAATLWLATSRAHGHDYVDGNPWTWVLWMWAITPTTWPLLVVLLGTLVVRVLSPRGRR